MTIGDEAKRTYETRSKNRETEGCTKQSSITENCFQEDNHEIFIQVYASDFGGFVFDCALIRSEY